MKRWQLVVAGLILTPGAAALVGCCAYSAPRWEGPTSDHFDGEQFVNQGGVSQSGGFDLIRWMVSRKQGAWPEWIDAEPGPRPPERVGRGEMRITFVNHATTLLQMDGVNILTDPIYSERSSPFSWIGPKRVRPPGIRFEDLPKIDAVIVSHNHYDHFDLPTLARLAERDHPRIFVGLGNNVFLDREDIDGGEELDWWDERELAPDVKLTGVPVQHFSRRGTCDGNATLWLGYVISGPAGRAYFAGDTGFGPHFAQVGERFGPIRLAILPIGAYEPEWFMGPIHVTPAEAVEAHRALRATTSIGMHFGTFPLADDGHDAPPRDLARALDRLDGPRPRFWVLDFGEGRDVPLE